MNELSWNKRFILLPCLLAILALGSFPAGAQTVARKLLNKIEPDYPALLRERNIGGTVKLKATVRADGTVRDVQIEGGNPTLAESAIRAVKLWRYSPGDRETVEDVAITFTPHKSW